MSIISEKADQYKYALAVWSDKTDFITEDSPLVNEDKLLEIRCFDESGEFRAYRSVTDSEFRYREIIGDKCDTAEYDGCYCENQYLDIDSKRADGNTVYSTSGGMYHLPEKAEKITVRYYWRYDEDMVARKCDWRLAGFVTKEGE